ncbi:MAG: DUF1800 domain-containing protein [Chloroflexi bacterium]|nr:DUF1800 domain-containing protein [Chloroflexota bacterium]
MSLSRRDFLKLGGLTAVSASATACSVLGRRTAQQDLPDSITAPTAVPVAVETAVPAQPVDPIWRFLNRAGYGPRPGDLKRVAEMGLEAYLEEQLAPDSIDDPAADLLVRNLNLYHMEITQLIGQDPREASRELIGATIGRALYSKRQLYEAMVEFWSDHFNIYLRKAQIMPGLKISDDRDIIRPHALGKFRDLLIASVNSPAMIVYLDNSRNHKDEPNENYARELMELHTLGVHGGYDQKDVQELARILTGWHIRRRDRRAGEAFLDGDAHDFGEKVLLGQPFPANRGKAEIDEAMDMLANHPATADLIAAKLVRRFVADDPPADLVEQVSQTFSDTDGDVKAMLRVIFLSDEFANAPMKLKRPFTFMISALRALNADVQPNRQIVRWSEWLGQPPFLWPTPDGYPDEAAAWAANLLPRWNFALNLVNNQILGVTPPLEKLIEVSGAADSPSILNLFAGLTLGRALDEETQTLFMDYVGDGPPNDNKTRQYLQDATALMIASPAFQWT